MRFGCCTGSLATPSDITGVTTIEELEEIGYDYIEPPLNAIMALSESGFDSVTKRVEDSGLQCEACNSFFPSDVRLTGDQADLSRAREYVTRAMDRAARIGVEVIVFGSAGARNVPEGFPRDRAWDQIAEVLAMTDPIADKHGITIAIEPLNRSESNIINTAGEGLALARQVAKKNIKLLVDYYHLVLESEDPEIIRRAGDTIRHVHIAKVKGRAFPTEIEEGFNSFFSNLKEVGYDARVSVEARPSDFHNDAVQALAVLKRLDQGSSRGSSLGSHREIR